MNPIKISRFIGQRKKKTLEIAIKNEAKFPNQLFRKMKINREGSSKRSKALFQRRQKTLEKN